MRNLFFLLLLPYSISLRCQSTTLDLPFQNISTRNGLSNKIVMEIGFRKNGMVLFGTFNGINSYDGTTVESFPIYPYAKDSLANARIIGMVQDSSGKFWFGTETLCSFDPKRKKFKSHYITTINNKTYYDYIIPFYVDDKNQIWLFAGKHQSILRFDPKSETFDTTYVRMKFQSQNYIPNKLSFQKVDTIYSWEQFQNNGLSISYLLPNGNRKMERIFSGHDGKIILSNIFNVKWYNRKLWIACGQGLVEYEPFTDQWQIYNTFQQLTLKDVSSIEGFGDQLWFGTRGQGIFIFDLKTKKIIHRLQHDPKNPLSLPGNDIQCIKIDAQSNLWVSVINHGVSYSNVSSPDIKITRGTLPIGDFAFGYAAKGFNHTVWLPIRNNGFIHFDPYKDTMLLHYNVKNSSLSSDIVNVLYESKDLLYIGTPQGLNILNIPTGKIKLVRGLESSFINYIAAIDKKVYCSTNAGFYKVDGYQSTRIRLIPEGLSQLAINSAFYEINPNNIIVSSADSMNLLHKVSDSVFVFKKNITSRYGAIQIVERDKKDTFKYYFFNEKFISEYNHNTGQVSLSKLNQSKWYSKIFAFAIDDQNRKWLGTNKGLFLLDQNKFYNFPDFQRLSLDEFQYLQQTLDNGDILFNTGKEGILIRPSLISPTAPPDNHLYLTNFKINDKPANPAVDIDFITSLILNYNQNSFSINASVIDFQAPETFQISYQMMGYDPHPVVVENPAMIRYTNVGAGTYTLIIKGIGSDGRESAYVKEIVLTIHPPWYQTWWFRIASLLAIIFIVWQFFKFRTSRLLEKQRLILEKELAVEKERKRIARDMHDDLGSGLSAIHLFSEHLKQNLSHKNPDLASDLDKIAQSSAELNIKVKEIIWNNENMENSVHALLLFLKKVTQVQYAGSSIAINFPDIGHESGVLGSEEGKNIYLCLKEAIHNSVKYSDCSIISVTYLETAKEKKFTIRDNGKGFNTDHVVPGHGIGNMKERMENIKGEFNLISDSHGTVITLTLY